MPKEMLCISTLEEGMAHNNLKKYNYMNRYFANTEAYYGIGQGWPTQNTPRST